jgi:hypothetical protein
MTGNGDDRLLLGGTMATEFDVAEWQWEDPLD